MLTFEHTVHGKVTTRDHPPSILPAIVLVVCGLILLPFTLLVFLVMLLSKVFWKPEPGEPEAVKSRA